MARIDSEMRRSLVGLKNQEKQRAGQCDIASEQGQQGGTKGGWSSELGTVFLGFYKSILNLFSEQRAVKGFIAASPFKKIIGKELEQISLKRSQ